nr:hypothetical protein [Tanacetum cinerariifolium]
MSSITAQQAKLDLKLVPKEKRLEIGKCNGRLNPEKIQREPHFKSFKIDKRKRFKLTLEIFRDIFKICPHVQDQDFDALPTDEEVVSFLRELRYTGEINSLSDVVIDHMHQPWRNFDALINKILSRKTTGLEKLRLSRAQIFKKPAFPKLTIVPVSTETPMGKSKRVKRPTKKSTETPIRGVVISETLKMPLTNKKEKVDVTHAKGIELLSQVALIKDAQFEEVRKKSMRDFYKTHPSGTGTVTKTAPSVAKIKPSTTSEGTSVEPKVPGAAKEESSKNRDQEKDNDDDKTQLDNELDSDSEHETDQSELGLESDHDESEENKEDDDDDEDETKITDKAKGDEDEEIDYSTSQFYNDVDIRKNEQVDADEGFI